MPRDLSHHDMEQRPVKDQHEHAKKRQRNLCTTLPSSARRNLSFFAHEAATLFPRGERANNAVLARDSALRVLASRVTLFDRSMSPDKLFNYLDGKLSPAQREEMERQLATDTHLQRELAMAREIHSRMTDVREVMLSPDVPVETQRGAVLGRRVAVAFAVLVFMNVVFGLYAIFFMEKKRRAKVGEGQNRQELVQALEKAGADALPTPNLEINEITIGAPAKQKDALANKVIAAAKQSGGSAVKNLNADNGLLLFAEIPAGRVNQFQEELKKLGATLPAATTPNAASGNAILQIRIIEAK